MGMNYDTGVEDDPGIGGVSPAPVLPTPKPRPTRAGARYAPPRPRTRPRKKPQVPTYDTGVEDDPGLSAEEQEALMRRIEVDPDQRRAELQRMFGADTERIESALRTEFGPPGEYGFDPAQFRASDTMPGARTKDFGLEFDTPYGADVVEAWKEIGAQNQLGKSISELQQEQAFSEVQDYDIGVVDDPFIAVSDRMARLSPYSKRVVTDINKAREAREEEKQLSPGRGGGSYVGAMPPIGAYAVRGIRQPIDAPELGTILNENLALLKAFANLPENGNHNGLIAMADGQMRSGNKRQARQTMEYFRQIQAYIDALNQWNNAQGPLSEWMNEIADPIAGIMTLWIQRRIDGIQELEAAYEQYKDMGMSHKDAATRAYQEWGNTKLKLLTDIGFDPLNLVPFLGFPGLILKTSTKTLASTVGFASIMAMMGKSVAVGSTRQIAKGRIQQVFLALTRDLADAGAIARATAGPTPATAAGRAGATEAVQRQLQDDRTRRLADAIEKRKNEQARRAREQDPAARADEPAPERVEPEDSVGDSRKGSRTIDEALEADPLTADKGDAVWINPDYHLQPLTGGARQAARRNSRSSVARAVQRAFAGADRFINENKLDQSAFWVTRVPREELTATQPTWEQRHYDWIMRIVRQIVEDPVEGRTWGVEFLANLSPARVMNIFGERMRVLTNEIYGGKEWRRKPGGDFALDIPGGDISSYDFLDLLRQDLENTFMAAFDTKESREKAVQMGMSPAARQALFRERAQQTVHAMLGDALPKQDEILHLQNVVGRQYHYVINRDRTLSPATKSGKRLDPKGKKYKRAQAATGITNQTKFEAAYQLGLKDKVLDAETGKAALIFALTNKRDLGLIARATYDVSVEFINNIPDDILDNLAVQIVPEVPAAWMKPPTEPRRTRAALIRDEEPIGVETTWEATPALPKGTSGIAGYFQWYGPYQDHPLITIIESFADGRHKAGHTSTIVHEISHYLEQFMPQAWLDDLAKEFEDDVAQNGRDVIVKAMLAERLNQMDLIDEAQAEHAWNKAYRYYNRQEWFAVTMTDRVLVEFYKKRAQQAKREQSFAALSFAEDVINRVSVYTYNFLTRRNINVPATQRFYKALQEGTVTAADRRPFLYDITKMDTYKGLMDEILQVKEDARQFGPGSDPKAREAYLSQQRFEDLRSEEWDEFDQLLHGALGEQQITKIMIDEIDAISRQIYANAEMFANDIKDKGLFFASDKFEGVGYEGDEVFQEALAALSRVRSEALATAKLDLETTMRLMRELVENQATRDPVVEAATIPFGTGTGIAPGGLPETVPDLQIRPSGQLSIGVPMSERPGQAFMMGAWPRFNRAALTNDEMLSSIRRSESERIKAEVIDRIAVERGITVDEARRLFDRRRTGHLTVDEEANRLVAQHGKRVGGFIPYFDEIALKTGRGGEDLFAYSPTPSFFDDLVDSTASHGEHIDFGAMGTDVRTKQAYGQGFKESRPIHRYVKKSREELEDALFEAEERAAQDYIDGATNELLPSGQYDTTEWREFEVEELIWTPEEDAPKGWAGDIPKRLKELEDEEILGPSEWRELSPSDQDLLRLVDEESRGLLSDHELALRRNLRREGRELEGWPSRQTRAGDVAAEAAGTIVLKIRQSMPRVHVSRRDKAGVVRKIKRHGRLMTPREVVAKLDAEDTWGLYTSDEQAVLIRQAALDIRPEDVRGVPGLRTKNMRLRLGSLEKYVKTLPADQQADYLAASTGQSITLRRIIGDKSKELAVDVNGREAAIRLMGLERLPKGSGVPWMGGYSNEPMYAVRAPKPRKETKTARKLRLQEEKNLQTDNDFRSAQVASLDEFFAPHTGRRRSSYVPEKVRFEPETEKLLEELKKLGITFDRTILDHAMGGKQAFIGRFTHKLDIRRLTDTMRNRTPAEKDAFLSSSRDYAAEQTMLAAKLGAVSQMITQAFGGKNTRAGLDAASGRRVHTAGVFYKPKTGKGAYALDTPEAYDAVMQLEEEHIVPLIGTVLDMINRRERYHLTRLQDRVIREIPKILNTDLSKTQAVGATLKGMNQTANRADRYIPWQWKIMRGESTHDHVRGATMYGGQRIPSSLRRQTSVDAEAFYKSAWDAKDHAGRHRQIETNIPVLMRKRLGQFMDLRIKHITVAKLIRHWNPDGAINKPGRLVGQVKDGKFRAEKGAYAPRNRSAWENEIPIRIGQRVWGVPAEQINVFDDFLTGVVGMRRTAVQVKFGKPTVRQDNTETVVERTMREEVERQVGRGRYEGERKATADLVDEFKGLMLNFDASIIGSRQGLLLFARDPGSWWKAQKDFWDMADREEHSAIWLSENLHGLLEAPRSGLQIAQTAEGLLYEIPGVTMKLGADVDNGRWWERGRKLYVERIPGLRQMNERQFQAVLLKGKYHLYQVCLSNLQMMRDGGTWVNEVLENFPILGRITGGLSRATRGADLTDAQLRELSADFVNNWVGGIEWGRVSAQPLPQLRKMMVLTEGWSRARIGNLINLPKLTPKGVLARRAFLQEIALVQTMGILANSARIGFREAVVDENYYDPTSRDFNVIRMGGNNMRLTPHAAEYRALARFFMGSRDDDFRKAMLFGRFELPEDANTVDAPDYMTRLFGQQLSWAEAYRRVNYLMQFIDDRQGQFPRIARDLLTNQTRMGQPITNADSQLGEVGQTLSYIVQQMMPILFQQPFEAIRKKTGLSPLAVDPEIQEQGVQFGMEMLGTSTWQDTLRQQIGGLARDMGHDISDEEYRTQLTPIERDDILMSKKGREIYSRSNTNLSAVQRMRVRWKSYDAQVEMDGWLSAGRKPVIGKVDKAGRQFYRQYSNRDWVNDYERNRTKTYAVVDAMTDGEDLDMFRPQTEDQKLIHDYYDIQKQFDNWDGREGAFNAVGWDIAKSKFFRSLNPDQVDYVKINTQRYTTDKAREYRVASELMNEYWDVGTDPWQMANMVGERNNQDVMRAWDRFINSSSPNAREAAQGDPQLEEIVKAMVKLRNDRREELRRQRPDIDWALIEWRGYTPVEDGSEVNEKRYNILAADRSHVEFGDDAA